MPLLAQPRFSQSYPVKAEVFQGTYTVTNGVLTGAHIQQIR